MDFIVLGLVVVFCLGYLLTRTPWPYCFWVISVTTSLLKVKSKTTSVFPDCFCTYMLWLSLPTISQFLTHYSRRCRLCWNGLSKPFLFAGISGVLFAWSGLRFLAIKFIGWVIEQPSFTSCLERTGRDYVIMAGFAFVPFLLAFSLVGKIAGNALFIIALVLIAYSCLSYAVRSLRIFLSAGFSVFFWILYLCTLELIPLGVLIYVFAGIYL